MKIAFLNGDVPTLFDGYHKLTNEIIYGLTEKFSVHLINYKGQKLEQSALPWNVSSYQTMVPEEEAYIKKRMYQVRSLFSKESMVPWQFKSIDLNKLNSMLIQLNPDIIIFNQLRAAWVLPHLSTNLHATIIYIAHNCESLSYRSVAELQTSHLIKKITKIEAEKVLKLEKEVLKRVDYCVALTPEDASRLQEIESKPIYTVIPPGTKIPDFKADEEKEISLLLVGSYKWDPKKKNALWLANEVLPLINQDAQKVSLKIVGAAANELSDFIQDKEHVEVYSDVPSTAPYFEGNHIFVIPERQEGGFKLKTLEAASYGLSIVSTSAGIEGSNLIHEESCLIANTKKEFAAQIKKLIASPDLRRKIGENAKKEVIQNFQWEKVNHLYVQLMQKAVKVQQ